jgi:very-short-patch-repair endonuclease
VPERGLSRASAETSVKEADSAPLDETMRLLVRHQWVREHDTPRVTVLAGSRRRGRALWESWLALAARSAQPLVEPQVGVDPSGLERSVRQALEMAVARPREPIALTVETKRLDAWLGPRDDRLSAVVQEGLIRLSAAGRTRQRPAGGSRTGFERRARSLAELTLFEALEATPALSGRFELNGLLSVAFGAGAAEVDLLSRQDEIAIEVDGFHHFTDATGYRRDRRKDAVLQAHGYTVLRFLAEDILADTGCTAVRMVLEMIGQQRRRWKGRGDP